MSKKHKHRRRCHWEFIGRVPMPTFYGNRWHEAYMFRCREDHRRLYYMDVNIFWTGGPIVPLDFPPKVRRRR